MVRSGHMGHAQRAAAVALVSAALASCELLVGIPQVSLLPDGGLDGTTPASGDGGADGTDEADADASAVADASGGPCGRVAADGAVRAGPDMVQIDAALGSYCIDTTEVTNAQFNVYLVASGAFIDTPGECDASGAPPVADQDPTHQDVAVGALGACHAWSYCRWAGKRLCGVIPDGGSVYAAARPEDTEWVYACINGAYDYGFPYGASYEAGTCNVDQPDGGPLPVKTKAACRGVAAPFDRIYDMVGNRWEYVNDLAGSGGNVSAHGGAWSSLASGMTGAGGGCGYTTNFQGANNFAFDESGFRCCADPWP